MKKTSRPAAPLSNIYIYSFVVHMWREKVSTKRFVWRGSLTDVQGGGTKYFQSLPVLAKLIAEAVGEKSKKEKI